MTIRSGQVYKNNKATFKIKSVGDQWIKAEVTKHGESNSRTIDLTESQVLKMEKIKG